MNKIILLFDKKDEYKIIGFYSTPRNDEFSTDTMCTLRSLYSFEEWRVFVPSMSIRDWTFYTDSVCINPKNEYFVFDANKSIIEKLRKISTMELIRTGGL